MEKNRRTYQNRLEDYIKHGQVSFSEPFLDSKETLMKGQTGSQESKRFALFMIV